MNCEPGDLARIIAPTEKNPNLGKIVQCKKIVLTNIYGDVGPVWMISSKEKLHMYHIVGHDQTLENSGPCPDAWLKPYRPPALDKSTTKNKELEKV